VQVIINFLPVGHTHEDIDGMFGCFSAKLKTKVIVTIPEVGNWSTARTCTVHAVTDAHTRTQQAEVLKEAFHKHIGAHEENKAQRHSVDVLYVREVADMRRQLEPIAVNLLPPPRLSRSTCSSPRTPDCISHFRSRLTSSAA
jgi:hypothetical protein